MTHAIFPPFNSSAWRAIDDRIRGGSSVSHLDAYPSHSRSQDGEKTHGAVRFWGTLDTRTLGGAGFASRCYTFPGEHGLWLDAERYAGVGIEFDVPSTSGENVEQRPGELEKPTRYTLVLKTSIPPTRPDGRRQSTISYEYTFSSHTTPTHGHTRRITIPWSAFVPTYRGRTITPSDPEYVPLNPGSQGKDGKRKGGIAEISLMCRSDFGKQEGEFELVVRRIEALGVQHGDKTEGEKRDLERQGERRGSRFPAVSWKALGLAVVLCVGLTYAVRQWGGWV